MLSRQESSHLIGRNGRDGRIGFEGLCKLAKGGRVICQKQNHTAAVGPNRVTWSGREDLRAPRPTSWRTKRLTASEPFQVGARGLEPPTSRTRTVRSKPD